MTKNKSFKRFVRQSAAAAGESYQRMRQRLSQGRSGHDMRSDEQRRRGRMLADLALRAADGKPVVVPEVPPHVVDLRNAVVLAQRQAGEPGAAPSLRERAALLSEQLDSAEEVWRAAEPISTVDYLARVARRDLAAIAVAQDICRHAIDFNPRDAVARDALELLDSVQRRSRPQSLNS